MLRPTIKGDRIPSCARFGVKYRTLTDATELPPVATNALGLPSTFAEVYFASGYSNSINKSMK